MMLKKNWVNSISWTFCVIVLLGFISCKEETQTTTTLNLSARTTNLSAIIAKIENGESLRIACYGNSITFGYSTSGSGQVAQPYPKELQRQLRSHFQNENVTVLNRGNSGWTAENARDDVHNQVLKRNVDLVVVMFGINDYYQGYSTSVFEEHLSALVDSFKEDSIEVLLMSPTPLAERESNEGLLEFCQAM